MSGVPLSDGQEFDPKEKKRKCPDGQEFDPKTKQCNELTARRAKAEEALRLYGVHQPEGRTIHGREAETHERRRTELFRHLSTQILYSDEDMRLVFSIDVCYASRS